MAVARIDLEEVITETRVAEVRPSTDEDAVLDSLPGLVAFPSTVDEVSRLLGWANSHGLKVVTCGSRTKLDRGAPPAQCDVLLDLSRLSGIVEHAAGDLTVTVRSGTGLDDLQRALAEAGQFLAIDPPVPGSVGGLIATADSGPRRLRYGGVRDLILGITFVRADGVVAKGGGKVVKNVAGYDLPKLLAGSLGTLGVIVEATFRLYPLPATSSTVLLQGITAAEAARATEALLTSGLVPTAVDYHIDSQGTTLAARFESSPLSVEAQAARATDIFQAQGPSLTLLESDELALWQRFDEITNTRSDDVLARLITTPADLPNLLEDAQAEASASGVSLSVRAHMGHGHALLRWQEPPTSVVRLLLGLREQAEAHASSVVVWRAPAEIRAQVEVWGNPGEGLSLMRRVKAQFDPNGTLNPGRFVGGI
jgi:glycolate oxidase FAD binding subunit